MRKFGGIKIGLAFEFQIMSELPYEENDVRVDKIITERRVIEGRG
jgi:5-formyltetrahydrofolate cyclo-ligase